MKVAFISDIHGNATALEAVLTDIERKKVDQIIVLGDICFRGPQPKRSLELVHALGAKWIKGNADVWVSRGIQEGEVPPQVFDMMQQERAWTMSQLDEKDLELLNDQDEDLFYTLNDQVRVHAFHAIPGNLFDVVLPEAPLHTLKDKIMVHPHANVYIYGHIHLPYVRFVEGKCVVNTGSVGLPFDGQTKASYAIVEADEDQYQVQIQRVDYDVQHVLKQLEEGHYPNLDLMKKVISQAVSPAVLTD